MIIWYCKLTTIMQHQEEDKAHKSIEKEYWSMTSMLTVKAFLIVQSVLPLLLFLQSSIPQNLIFASRVTTLEMDSIFSSRIVYFIYKRYLELSEKIHCGLRVSLVSEMSSLPPSFWFPTF